MVNLSFLKQFTKQDPVKMKRYISLYLEVAPATFEKMSENLKAENWEQLRINAHSLKPQAEFMGASSLKESLIKIEDAVGQNKTEQLSSLYKNALALHLESNEQLKKILTSMNE